MQKKEKIALISIGTNALLAGIKILLATISGSIALLADAWHSGSDIFVSLLVFVGLKLSKSQEKKKFPVRIENIIATIVSVFILTAAYKIFRKALLLPSYEIQKIPLITVGILACIIISYLLAHYKILIGRETNSPSLIADGYHSKADMYTSIVVLIGIIGYLTGIRLDKWAAMIIVLSVAGVGIEILGTAVSAMFTHTSFDLDRVLHFFRRMESSKIGRIPGKIGQKFIFGIRAINTGVINLYRHLQPHGKIIGAASGFILILIYFSTGFYTIKPGWEGIEKRFGRKTVVGIQPGLHYHWPYPVEEVKKIATHQLRYIEIGFRTLKGETRIVQPARLWECRHIAGVYTKKLEEALILTGDENIIDLNLTVQYGIKDAAEYLFNITRAEELMRSAGESVIRQIVGSEEIDVILTEDRRAIEQESAILLQKVLDKYQPGIEIKAVYLQDIHPPVEVVPNFRDVASAEEDKCRYVNEAYSYYNSVVPETRGRAAEKLVKSEANKEEKILRATGEADRFIKKVEQYVRTPDITRTRLYIEAMEKILPGTKKLIFEPEIMRPGLPGLWFTKDTREINYLLEP